jgi:hypothetical protein
MNILDPQGPVAAADKTILIDSIAIMLAIVLPTIAAIFAFAFYFRKSNTRAFYWPDWEYSGRLELVVGSPGGPTIITTVAQVILNVLDHHMSLPDAVAAPRVHHQALPDLIRYEKGGLAQATVDSLKALGHRVEQRGGTSGIVAAIGRGPNGGWIGVADPRYAGGSAGY